MRLSDITLALRAEKRERFEAAMKEQDRSEWRDYIAERKRAPEDRRDEITGY